MINNILISREKRAILHRDKVNMITCKNLQYML